MGEASTELTCIGTTGVVTFTFSDAFQDQTMTFTCSPTSPPVSSTSSMLSHSLSSTYPRNIQLPLTTSSTSHTSPGVQTHISSTSTSRSELLRNETLTDTTTVYETSISVPRTTGTTQPIPSTITHTVISVATMQTESQSTMAKSLASSSSIHTHDISATSSLTTNPSSSLGSMILSLTSTPSVTSSAVPSRDGVPVLEIVGIVVAGLLSVAVLLFLTRCLYHKRARKPAPSLYTLDLSQDSYKPYPTRFQRFSDRSLLIDREQLRSSDALITRDARSYISSLFPDAGSATSAQSIRWSWDGVPPSAGLHSAQKGADARALPSVPTVQSRHSSQVALQHPAPLTHFSENMPPQNAPHRQSLDGGVRLAGGPLEERVEHDTVSVHTLPPAYQW